MTPRGSIVGSNSIQDSNYLCDPQMVKLPLTLAKFLTYVDVIIEKKMVWHNFLLSIKKILNRYFFHYNNISWNFQIWLGSNFDHFTHTNIASIWAWLYSLGTNIYFPQEQIIHQYRTSQDTARSANVAWKYHQSQSSCFWVHK